MVTSKLFEMLISDFSFGEGIAGMEVELQIGGWRDGSRALDAIKTEHSAISTIERPLQDAGEGRQHRGLLKTEYNEEWCFDSVRAVAGENDVELTSCWNCGPSALQGWIQQLKTRSASWLDFAAS